MYLFFVRHFNDIDHIAPVVWRMNRDGYAVALYCMNPEYDMDADYRLVYLRKQGVPVNFVYDVLDGELGSLHRVLRRLISRLLSLDGRADATDHSKGAVQWRIFRHIGRKMGRSLFKLTRRGFYTGTWAQKVLEHADAKALCFDWIMPGKYVVDKLLLAARQLSVPTFSLPHGVSAFSNDAVRDGATKTRRFEKFNQYDFLIVQNESRKAYVTRSGLAEEKIVILGSTRYCAEWMVENERILPRRLEPRAHDGGRLKVVFMTTRFEYRIDVDRMFRTFDLLSSFEGLDVMIKPHTRTDREAHLFERLPMQNASHISSAELVEWADVVLVIATSVAIEALVLGKPLVYLKYLHGNRTLYEEFGACWTVESERELEVALQSLKQDKGKLPYDEEKVDDFLKEVVYGGRDDKDVLGNHETFILNSRVQ